ncbi:MAG: hypothetical protein ACT4O9_17430, partial [Blastocatellia bacterium]
MTTGAFYDNDGRRTYGDGVYFKFDAAGAMHETSRTANYETKLYQDGLGRESKRSQRTWDAGEEEWEEWDSKYLIHSSVFGRIITEAEKTGRKWRTFVMANGSSIARQSKNESGSGSLLTYEYREASGLSAGNAVSPTSDFAHAFLREELDGLGNNVGHVAVENPLDEARNSQSPIDRMAIESMDMGFCNAGGIFGPCDIVENLDILNLSPISEHGSDRIFPGLERIFGRDVGYPVEFRGRSQSNRNSPFYIAHEILRNLYPDSLEAILNTWARQEKPDWRPLIPKLRYNQRTLADLIGPLPVARQKLGAKLKERVILDAVSHCAWHLYGTEITSFHIAGPSVIGSVGVRKDGEDYSVNTTSTTISDWEKWTGTKRTSRARAATPARVTRTPTGAVLHPLHNFIFTDGLQ